MKGTENKQVKRVKELKKDIKTTRETTTKEVVTTSDKTEISETDEEVLTGQSSDKNRESEFMLAIITVAIAGATLFFTGQTYGNRMLSIGGTIIFQYVFAVVALCCALSIGNCYIKEKSKQAWIIWIAFLIVLVCIIKCILSYNVMKEDATEEVTIEEVTTEEATTIEVTTEETTTIEVTTEEAATENAEVNYYGVWIAWTLTIMILMCAMSVLFMLDKSKIIDLNSEGDFRKLWWFCLIVSSIIIAATGTVVFGVGALPQ